MWLNRSCLYKSSAVIDMPPRRIDLRFGSRVAGALIVDARLGSEARRASESYPLMIGRARRIAMQKVRRGFLRCRGSAWRVASRTVRARIPRNEPALQIMSM